MVDKQQKQWRMTIMLPDTSILELLIATKKGQTVFGFYWVFKCDGFITYMTIDCTL